MLRIGFLIFILVSWEIYAQGVSRALLAPPSEIVPAFYNLFIVEPVMLEALGTTLFALLVGLTIAIVLGVILGVLIGLNRTVELVVGPYISFLFAIPSIALIPLLVVWFGIGLELRIVLVVISAIFPVIINTATGIRQSPVELIETATSFVASPWQVLITARLPASLPYMFAGVNLALSLALAGVVVAEMTAAITGLGGLIITFSNFFQTANLFVPILTLMAMSIAINSGVARLEIALMPWERLRRQGSRT
jgi:NitT/TauT family transport system permease protein